MNDKSGAISKTLFKKTARVKEKLYERLGKADRTTDEIFEEQAKNFETHYKDVDNFHTKFKQYVHCMKALKCAKREFCESVRDIYSTDWPGQEHIRAMTQSLELCTEEHVSKLTDDALPPLEGYSTQFPDLKAKIEKRSRKLLDFDNARHNLEALEANNKHKNDIKIQKANLELQETKRHYDDINEELLESLPKLYDGRVSFAAHTLESIFTMEARFHAETAKLCNELSVQLTRLATVATDLSHEHERVSRRESNSGAKNPPQGSVTSTPPKVPPSPSVPKTPTQSESVPAPPVPAQPSSPGPESPAAVPAEPQPETRTRHSKKAAEKNESHPTTDEKISEKVNGIDANENSAQGNLYPAVPAIVGDDKPVSKESGKGDEGQKEEEDVPSEEQNGKNPFEEGEDLPGKGEEESQDKVVKEETEEKVNEENAQMTQSAPKAVQEEKADKIEAKLELEAGIKYRVKATHKYNREDIDELSFESGEIIKVVDFDGDPDEQDPGWLMGIKELTGEKGVFPENFTTRI